MKAALTVTFFATVCLICDTIAQGDIDATVNDALQSALFGDRPAPSVARFGSAGFWLKGLLFKFLFKSF